MFSASLADWLAAAAGCDRSLVHSFAVDEAGRLLPSSAKARVALAYRNSHGNYAGLNFGSSFFYFDCPLRQRHTYQPAAIEYRRIVVVDD